MRLGTIRLFGRYGYIATEMVSRDELLAELRRLAEEFGRRPTRALMASYGTVDPERYDEVFGTWEDALHAADLGSIEPPSQRAAVLSRLEEDRRHQFQKMLDSNEKTKFVKGQLLVELHRLAEDLDKTPSIMDMRNYGQFSDKTYSYHFGSWSGAIEEAGLEPNDPPERIPDEKVLAELRQVAKHVNRQPTASDMREHGQYSAWTVYNRFDSWEEACRSAGIEISR